MQLARVVGASIGVAAAIATTALVMALPASAHTPKLTAACEDGKTTLTVSLKAYAQSTDKRSNHITVTLDGKEIEDRSFDREFEATYTAPGDVKHDFIVEVTAHDDKKYSFTEPKTVDPCVQKVVPSSSAPSSASSVPSVPSSAPSTPSSVSSAPAPVTSVVATTSAAPVVPVGDTNPLANTGASIAIPLVIGIVLLGGGVALLVVLRRRAANN